MPRSKPRRRALAFHPVPLRSRKDGWTPLRQAEFIGHLVETGSVCEAAQRVGMTRETAYRLRRRAWAQGFAAAWDAALGKVPMIEKTPLRKVTNAELVHRLDCGLWRPMMYRGRFVSIARKADNCALLALVSRLGIARAAARTWEQDK